MNRFTASAVHLAISVTIAAAVFAGLYFLWYPDELFNVAGGRQLFFLIAGVDVVLGPLVTLIIFAPRKKGLKFDLAVIGTLQLAALLYGLGVLYVSRPVYVVFVQDRFELMRANDYPDSELERVPKSPYRRFSVTGPNLVGARMPSNRVERDRIMFLAPNGIDLQHMLQHYVPYDTVRPEVSANLKPISKLRSLNPRRSEDIDRLIRGIGRDESAIGFLPMRADLHDLAVIVDRKSGDVIRMAELNPWDP